MKEFDINKLSKLNSRNIKIGELSKEVIDILNLDLKPQNINIWPTRIEEHCEKHKLEYSNPTAYVQAIKSIPLIIQKPDYVGLHSNGNIQYVKKLDDISMLGVQILKGNSGLIFRTIYPITEDKLNHLIRIGKIFPLGKN